QAEDFPGSDVFLMDFDTAFAAGDGTAVISIGNPEKAEHIGRVIPGLNNSLINIAGTTQKAVEVQVGVVAERSQEWAANNSAVVGWLGYDAPNGFVDGYFPDEARQGSQALAKFTRELRAGSAESQADPAIHDYGHSFGTTVQGLATCGGMKVDDSVHLGSPGTSCAASEQLRHGAERVWAATAVDDPIHLAAIMAPLGPNPNWDPDARRLSLDSRKKQSGHGEYFEANTVGIENIALLQTGDHGLVD
ncbi:MAG: alpha/beta hydrolase family protein, partial [Actinobacteria bacterium]|nr:alpha/beta hydrolase family protein [Actinomycetota bacterium]